MLIDDVVSMVILVIDILKMLLVCVQLAKILLLYKLKQHLPVVFFNQYILAYIAIDSLYVLNTKIVTQD